MYVYIYMVLPYISIHDCVEVFYYWGYQIGDCETCVLENVLICKPQLSHSIKYIKLFELQLMLHEINIWR